MKTDIINALNTSLSRLKDQQLLGDDINPIVKVEHTKDKTHGHFATNIAMMLAKPLGKSPRDIAQWVIDALPKHDSIEKVEIAGPGFINFFIRESAICDVVATILSNPSNFGKNSIGQGKKIHIEFVSANPTGPLHVGHGRGAAYGATLSNILEAVGYQVHREYYVNDAGRQMHILGTSIWLRYLELCGETFAFPVNGYKGDYVRDIASSIFDEKGKAFWRSADYVIKDLPQDGVEEGVGDKEAHIDALIERAKTLLGDQVYHLFFKAGLDTILKDIRDDLADYGVVYNEWFSEQSLENQGAVQHGLDELGKRDLTETREGALWFRSTQFGDDKDRVLKRQDGRTTYFASDVAYHVNKIERGFDIIIDVLGADHHGYVPRVRAAMRGLGIDDTHFVTPIVQFATLYRQGKKVQMSTRSGEFVTLRELREEIGNDAARFFYIMRKPEQHMDFDLDLAKSQSSDNPVYYVQYAHARIASVFRQMTERGWDYDESLGLQHLEHHADESVEQICQLLSRYPETVTRSAQDYEPHVIAHYLRELAHLFHVYYNATPFLTDDVVIRNTRLVLIKAVQSVLSQGLSLLGVSSPQRM